MRDCRSLAVVAVALTLACSSGAPVSPGDADQQGDPTVLFTPEMALGAVQQLSQALGAADVSSAMARFAEDFTWSVPSHCTSGEPCGATFPWDKGECQLFFDALFAEERDGLVTVTPWDSAILSDVATVPALVELEANFGSWRRSADAYVLFELRLNDGGIPEVTRLTTDGLFRTPDPCDYMAFLCLGGG